MTDRQRLVNQLMHHEGLKLKPYTDTTGNVTIGVGRNLTGKGISSQEAFSMLEHDIDEAVYDLSSFSWFAGLDPVRQRVLVDMRFNLGPHRFRGFRQMIHAVAVGDYDGAARQMLHSKWATQVHGRADRLAEMMRTGEDDE